MDEPEWMGSIRVSEKPQLENTTNQNVKVVRTTMLHVRMAETRVRVVFGIGKNLPVPSLLAASLIIKFVIEMLPAKRKIVSYNSQPVGILMVHEASNDKQTFIRATDVAVGTVLDVRTEEEEKVARLARATILQTMSKIPSQ